MLDRLRQSSLLRSLLAAIAALLGYGGWAVFVNLPFGVDAGIRAGVVQGSYAFTLTLCTTWLMEHLFRRLRARSGSPVIASALTIILVCSGLFATAYAINWLAFTPRIVMTILPGFILGSVYTTIYVSSLSRLGK